ncbi:class I SAM-dependent methyltransferase [Lacimicrobium alkaliphilum]|uniref:SAM-dependent methyltransferase n=1 Tax=Lacimicrobium alkaliphilum TaxID=1526571 RepID=A0ABQ1R750_9ALTE|nr:class I SAM-dependent methyltransferase [Lacimicrobium alkaliphilum]GGD59624.1 SAM-dependent methyltransferase [Lacimicrobium alkaliphilum]
MSLDYYQQHAQAFFEGTVDVDMQLLYQRFLPLLPAGAHILDAGCGSGRDAFYFLQQGYRVTAFDASAELVAMASELTAIDVRHCRFDEMTLSEPVQGIWACASLLHVPHADLAATFAHLASFLESGGWFYCSFKYGQGEVCRDGRTFSNLDEAGLESVINATSLKLKESWQTADLRPGREQERWLNALLVKTTDVQGAE